MAQHVKRLDRTQQHQTDTYILKGTGRETWHSRFTYHGFQYVEVTGFPGKPTLDNLQAWFMHSAVPEAGDFTCSNPLLNRIQRATRWSFLSNLQGIPTDCPHREKNGWTGDAHLACEQAQFNFFPAPVHQKWINDLGDEQKPTGALPGIVPTSGWGYGFGSGPAWDSAFLLIPYYEYLYYGDTENFRRHYEGMKRYLDYLNSRSKNDIVRIGLNDWAPWKTKTDAAITDTAYYYVDAKIVALAADLLGNKSDAHQYSELAARIKTAFNQRFFQPGTALYDNGGQTALSCALYQGLVEPENKSRVLTNLVAAVERTNNHIDTGILGAKYLLNSLLENGRADVAYRVVSQKDQPSWGWWLEQGATTLWEQWNGTESRNHIMFGDVSAWFYKTLAGIQPDPQSPGFKHFFVTPQPLGDLTSARGVYDSIHGKIVSDWQVSKGQFELRLTIPANTTATVSLPIAEKVLESGKPISQSVGVNALRTEGGRSLFEVGSGSFLFSGPITR
jgi:alpha-L-rhamnosidase